MRFGTEKDIGSVDKREKRRKCVRNKKDAEEKILRRILVGRGREEGKKMSLGQKIGVMCRSWRRRGRKISRRTVMSTLRS